MRNSRSMKRALVAMLCLVVAATIVAKSNEASPANAQAIEIPLQCQIPTEVEYIGTGAFNAAAEAFDKLHVKTLYDSNGKRVKHFYQVLDSSVASDDRIYGCNGNCDTPPAVIQHDTEPTLLASGPAGTVGYTWVLDKDAIATGASHDDTTYIVDENGAILLELMNIEFAFPVKYTLPISGSAYISSSFSVAIYPPCILPPEDPTATPTDTPVPPTDTPVPPTDTPVPPTDTPVPPTDTPVLPTDTPVLPTDTPVPPTNTPVPPTNTPVPPTNTPVPPTNTPVPPTDTPIPPTATSTNTPKPTNTPVRPQLPPEIVPTPSATPTIVCVPSPTESQADRCGTPTDLNTEAEPEMHPVIYLPLISR